MDKEKLERVRGIARFHEAMWIERAEGKIKQVYDKDFNPIETYLLYRSFRAIPEKEGFYYLDEWIPLKGANEYARKRAQGYQRRNHGHSTEEML